jgi:hypothetical protein
MLTLGKSADEVKNKFKSLVSSLTIPKNSKVSIDTYRSSLELIYKSMPTTIR